MRRNRQWLPWILAVIWRPDIALDLLDKEGKPDHAKIMGYYAFTVFIVLILLDKLPPLGHTIVLCSVIFGWIGMRTFLASRAATSSEVIQTKLEFGERLPDDTRDP